MKKLVSLMQLATALCAGLIATQAAAFCGFYAGKADASLFNEASQVVLARDGQRTVITMLNDYKGPLTQFALVVPTPEVIKQGQVRIAERATFERLDAYSSPRLAEYHDSDPCVFRFNWGNNVYAPTAPLEEPVRRVATISGSNRSHGVTVEAKYTLEEYDIVSLSAKASSGLEIWLRENGYNIPKGASAALKPYINQGMKFFVAKVNLKEQAKTGYTNLRPLQFAYESEKFMLPMRLGMLNAAPDKAQDLINYLLTRNGRVESSNYRTANLPANMDLPFFIKPRFQEFYKAMFANATAKEDYRVVFTEYFWNMAWCDPCAAEPLKTEELRNAGVFWLDGDAERGFAFMRNPISNKIVSMPASGAQPAMLTRLHVRYTPASFPEDLMFTQTRDQMNFQARYVVKNPYNSTVDECSKKLDWFDCEAQCDVKLSEIKDLIRNGNEGYINRAYLRDDETLKRECKLECSKAKAATLASAKIYYHETLPSRIWREKKELASLTGWSMADIDKMPDAQKYAFHPALSSSQQLAENSSWWQRLLTKPAKP